MRFPALITLVTFSFGLGLIGSAMAWEKVTFNSVPANIADSPVDEWHYVERERGNGITTWYLSFDDSSEMWIEVTDPGRYWRASGFTEDKWIQYAKDWGFNGFRRIESLRWGGQWGVIAIATRDERPCVILGVLDKDNFGHDGVQGGTLRMDAGVCGVSVPIRFDEWKAWGKSFKRVSSGYNSALDE